MVLTGVVSGMEGVSVSQPPGNLHLHNSRLDEDNHSSVSIVRVVAGESGQKARVSV